MNSLPLIIALFFFAICFSAVNGATFRFAMAAPGLKNTQLVQNETTNIYNLSTPDITPYTNFSAGSYVLELYANTGLVIGTYKLSFDKL